MDGDVDVFVEDDTDLIYMQLKRSLIRITPRESYNELINSDLKAARQLNKAEEFLRVPNNIYYSEKVPKKWIVSTSNENTGQVFLGAEKMSYFDLLHQLENPEVKSLRDLTNSMDFDEAISESIDKILSDEFGAIELIENNFLFSSIRNFGPDSYTLMLSESKSHAQFLKFWSEANAANNKGEQRKLLEKCITVIPKDGTKHLLVGKCLSKMGESARALDIFCEALEIFPHDPLITSYYSTELFANRQFYNALTLLCDSLEKYRNMFDLRKLLRDSLNYCIRKGLLSQAQLLEINTRYAALK